MGKKVGEYINENQFASGTVYTGGGAASPNVNRNLSRRWNYTNPISENAYRFVDNTYYGTGGYRDGTYLIPFSKESDYMSRRTLAHYKNYFRPIIDSMIVPVFNEEAKRTTNSVLYSRFLVDVDAAGSGQQSFSKSAMTIMRRHGVVFVVMDNFESSSMPKTKPETLRNRQYPYIYIRTAADVESYECNQFGVLQWITFREKSEKTKQNNVQLFTSVGQPMNKDTGARYRKWTSTYSELLTKDMNGNWIILDHKEHNLGVIPIIMSYAGEKEDKSEILPDPPLYDIARINLQIFQMSAEIRDQERAQAFATMYLQGVNADSLTGGPKNVIVLDDEASITPGFVQPSWEIFKGLIEHEEKLRQDIYLIAERAGVVGVQSSRSGIALQWQFIGHESVLKETANIAEILERKIAILFSMYVNEKITYNVEYKHTYSPVGIDDEVNRYEKILKIPGINNELNKAIQIRMARTVLHGMDPEMVDSVINSIKEEKNELEKQQKPEETEDKSGNGTEADAGEDESGDGTEADAGEAKNGNR